MLLPAHQLSDTTHNKLHSIKPLFTVFEIITKLSLICLLGHMDKPVKNASAVIPEVSREAFGAQQVGIICNSNSEILFFIS